MFCEDCRPRPLSARSSVPGLSPQTTLDHRVYDPVARMVPSRGARVRQYLVFVLRRSDIRHWIRSCRSLPGTLHSPTICTWCLWSFLSGSETATDGPGRLVRKRALSRAQLASLQSGVTSASRASAGLYEVVR